MTTERSNVRWIPIGELGEVRMGKQLSPMSTGRAESTPYLRVANVFEDRIDYGDVKSMYFSAAEREVYGLRPGDILLNEGQSLDLVGRSAVYGGQHGEMCFQNTLIRYRPGPAVLPEYAQAVFRRWRTTGTFARIARQTTSVAHLGADRFAAMPFPLIPLREQHRIIDAMTTLDEALERCNQYINKLRIVEAAVARRQLADISARYDTVPTQTLFEVRGGITLGPTRVARGNPHPYLRVANVRRGSIYLHEVLAIEATSDDCEKWGLRADDLLMVEGHANPKEIGRCALAGKAVEGMLYQNHLFRLRSDRVVPAFAELWFNSDRVSDYWRTNATTTSGLYTINRAQVSRIPFPSADTSTQRAILLALEAPARSRSTASEELGKLTSLKQGLMDHLLSGHEEMHAAAPSGTIAAA